jgi:hypothetical protein
VGLPRRATFATQGHISCCPNPPCCCVRSPRLTGTLNPSDDPRCSSSQAPDRACFGRFYGPAGIGSSAALRAQPGRGDPCCPRCARCAPSVGPRSRARQARLEHLGEPDASRPVQRAGAGRELGGLFLSNPAAPSPLDRHQDLLRIPVASGELDSSVGEFRASGTLAAAGSLHLRNALCGPPATTLPRAQSSGSSVRPPDLATTRVGPTCMVRSKALSMS